jgi:hypothetical protein
MSQRTTLASGEFGLRGDRLSVVLVTPMKPADAEMVLLVWPPKPTPCTPASLPNVVAVVTRILSSGSLQLAALRAQRHLATEPAQDNSEE